MGAVHHTIAPSMYPKLDYDLEKDFVPLALGTVERLDNLRRALTLGETRQERWTFYPDGCPRQRDCRLSGVRLAWASAVTDSRVPCSASVSVTLSPVVPHGTRPVTPPAI